MQRIRFVCALLVCCCGVARAQKPDSVLNIYAAEYQQEKIHVQFDKPLYNKGETVWFKVYLMAGTDLSEYSKNLYVDWYDLTGKLLRHSVSPVFRSSAKGQFEIPAEYTGQILRVKAYTQWMLNFDSAFIYSKDIAVNQSATARSAPPPKPVTSIHFFPEGGDMVKGVSCVVAFKAVNQFGKPVNVSGAVKNSKGELLDSFISRHDGMGTFSIDQPQPAEKYTVYWTDGPGKEFSSILPPVKDAGATIQVQPLLGKTLVAIKRSDNAPADMRLLNLVATMNQQVVYRSKVNLGVKDAGFAEIPTENLPSEVLQITLFTTDWIPVSERVVFVNNHQHEFYTEVNTPIKSTAKRGKNVMEVYVSDSVAANLSISVTDAALGIDSSSDIISGILLKGDIKGEVYHPSYYFSSEADSVARNLDLVMMTHGWRRIKWEDVMRSKLPSTLYSRDSDYLQIKGKVFGGVFNRSGPGQSINVIVTAKDTTKARQKQFLILPVNRDGTFAQKGTVFFDTVRLYYMFNGDRKLTDRTEVSFQNGLLPVPRNNISNVASLYGKDYVPGDSAALRQGRLFYDQTTQYGKQMAVHNLQEVTVHTRSKSALDILDEKYTSGLFSSGDGYQFDIEGDQLAQSSLDVFRYLQGRIAGLNVNMSNGTPTLSWRGGTPDLFLDEIATQADVLQGISMSNIAYIKVFRPPFFGAFGGGAGGAIAVYTRKGGDTRGNASGQGLESAILAGYTPYKEFYSPDYSTPSTNNDPDLRSTIYWNPFVLTGGKSRTVRIEFYNNDISKKLNIVMEGINAEGKVTRVQKTIE